MYIKLSFTQDKNIMDVYRILDDIINVSSTTNITALMTRVGTVYAANLADGLTTSTSDLIRTVSPNANVTKSHFAATNLSTGNYKWTLEQSSYDSTSTKYYIQLSGNSLSVNGSTCIVGNAITGGTITSSSCAISVAYRSSASNGTALTVAGSTYGTVSSSVLVLTSQGQTNVRHMWMYINDKCIVMAMTPTTTYSTGWTSSYPNSANLSGPWIFGQYTRFDYWNTDSNGIIPFVFPDTFRGAGQGFGNTSDINNNSNYYYPTGAATSIPLLVYNTVNAFPAVTSSWPLVYNAVPCIQWGYRETGYQDPLTTVNLNSGYTTPCFGKGISNTSAERWPSSDLSGTSFQLIALGWTLDRYGNSGGNISDRSGIWLFNGDYQPGDEFALGGKTWSVWPIYNGYADRIGLAIPKE
jgi:hypothetical protein